MGSEYIRSFAGRGKVVLIVTSMIVLLVGLHSQLDSHWKRWHESEYNLAILDSMKAKGYSVPAYSMEVYFVTIIQVFSILTLINFGVSMIINTTAGILKYIDIGYHIVAALLLLIAGIVYIISAKQIGNLSLSWIDKSDMKLRVGLKIFAGSVTIIHSIVYGVVAFVIAKESHVVP
ncbi:unnamed protein product [Orchesella dallaii]|uniref:Uncharacterized protein n=1 Tax=Orchesella dallaii TaxID=48710 RepID=A0ABP1RWS3_9HEXA